MEYDLSDSATYTNNRRDGYGYDADGRTTTIDARTTTYDAAGRQIEKSTETYGGSSYSVTQTHSFDGAMFPLKTLRRLALQVYETLFFCSL